MTKSTIEEIKKIENEAAQMVEKTKEANENLAKEAHIRGQNTLNNAQEQAQSQISDILEKAKQDIQNLKNQKERKLENSLSSLNSIDKRTIDAAAKVVIKSISK